MKVRKHRTTWILAVILAMLMTLLSGCGKPEYTVIFDLNGGELVSGDLMQEVTEGEAAEAPEAMNGRLSLSWDSDFSAVYDNITVTARWEKVPMDPDSLRAYMEERNVTIDVLLINGESYCYTGAFIDDMGTILTSWYAMEMVQDLTVTDAEGTVYAEPEILGCDPVLELALLSVDCPGSHYYAFSDSPAAHGQELWNLSWEGEFVSALVSDADSSLGDLSYFQLDTELSGKAMGGPVVDVYGELTGVSSYSRNLGDIMVQPSVLELLDLSHPMTEGQFAAWYEEESGQSYSPVDMDGGFHYSLVNTYQAVTGRECNGSVDIDGNLIEGYQDMCLVYGYDYSDEDYSLYSDYLLSQGFVSGGSVEIEDGSGTAETFYNENTGVELDIIVSADRTELITVCTVP